MPRFSIVIPVFNVEDYLRETLDSLLAQTFTDFEAICVNDCSPDSSQSIIEEYCAKDSRFKLINNEVNMSLFASRHIGVAQSTGEYILFLDSDDAFVPEALEKVNAQLIKRPVDILRFEMLVVLPEGTPFNKDVWYAIKFDPVYLQGDDIVRVICHERPTDMGMHHCAIRGDLARDVLPKMGFARDVIVAEDVAELTGLMVSASTFESIADSEWYIYNVGRGVLGNNQSLTCEEFMCSSRRIHNCYNELIAYLDRNHLHTPLVDEAVAARWSFACDESLYSWHLRVPSEQMPQALSEYIELWPDYWVLPYVYGKILIDTEILLAEESLDSQESRSAAKRLDAVFKSLFPLQWRLESRPDYVIDDIHRIEKSQEGLPAIIHAVAEGSCNRAALDMLLCNIRLLCFSACDHIWQVVEFRKREVHLKGQCNQLENKYEQVLNSKRYKIGEAIAKPYSAIRGLLRR